MLNKVFHKNTCFSQITLVNTSHHTGGEVTILPLTSLGMEGKVRTEFTLKLVYYFTGDHKVLKCSLHVMYVKLNYLTKLQSDPVHTFHGHLDNHILLTR